MRVCLKKACCEAIIFCFKEKEIKASQIEGWACSFVSHRCALMTHIGLSIAPQRCYRQHTAPHQPSLQQELFLIHSELSPRCVGEARGKTCTAHDKKITRVPPHHHHQHQSVLISGCRGGRAVGRMEGWGREDGGRERGRG